MCGKFYGAPRGGGRIVKIEQFRNTIKIMRLGFTRASGCHWSQELHVVITSRSTNFQFLVFVRIKKRFLISNTLHSYLHSQIRKVPKAPDFSRCFLFLNIPKHNKNPRVVLIFEVSNFPFSTSQIGFINVTKIKKP